MVRSSMCNRQLCYAASGQLRCPCTYMPVNVAVYRPKPGQHSTARTPAPCASLPSPRADDKCGCWPNAHCYGECAQYPAYGETTYGWKYSLHVE